MIDGGRVFVRAETALNDWGRACRSSAESFGLPRVGGLASMIDHVQAETRKQKKRYREALAAARKAWKKGDPPIDPKLVAEGLGFVEPSLTARGKQKISFVTPRIQVDTRILKIDAVIALLPGWMNATIKRSYLFEQPDRKAAQDLRIPKSTYRLQRIAAVEYFIERMDIAGHRL